MTRAASRRNGRQLSKISSRTKKSLADRDESVSWTEDDRSWFRERCEETSSRKSVHQDLRQLCYRHVLVLVAQAGPHAAFASLGQLDHGDIVCFQETMSAISDENAMPPNGTQSTMRSWRTLQTLLARRAFANSRNRGARTSGGSLAFREPRGKNLPMRPQVGGPA